MKTLILMAIVFTSFSSELLIENSGDSFYLQNKMNHNQILQVNRDTGVAKLYNIESGSESDSIEVERGCINSGLYFDGLFLVSPETTCLYDSEKKKIEFWGLNDIPTGAFSISKFYETRRKSYYIFNGLDYLNSTTGYIKVKSIDKRSGDIEIIDLVEGVPHFSAGINFNEETQEFYMMTTSGYYDNILHEMNGEALYNAFRNDQIIEFDDLVINSTERFEGLSFNLLVLEDGMVVNNSNAYGESYNSVFYDGQNFETLDIDCEISGQLVNSLLLNCAGDLLLERF